MSLMADLINWTYAENPVWVERRGIAGTVKAKAGKATKTTVKRGVDGVLAATMTPFLGVVAKVGLIGLSRHGKKFFKIWMAIIDVILALTVMVDAVLVTIAVLLLSGLLAGGYITGIDKDGVVAAPSGNYQNADAGGSGSSVDGKAVAGFDKPIPTPKDMDPKEWAKASPLQQSIALNAMVYSTMDMPKGGVKKGHNKLVYEQGNTGIGHYDCSTFMTSVLESLGLNDKLKRIDRKYDFQTMKKSDLTDFMSSRQYTSYYKGKPELIATNSNEAGWKDKLVPGDMLVMDGHVMFYVGKNKDGVQLVAHSARSTSFLDVMLTQKAPQMGISKAEVFYKEYTVNHGVTIYAVRPDRAYASANK